MKIHFVCAGNMYRSRLAEAYAKSLAVDDMQITSSGIHAESTSDGDICWYAEKILKEYELLEFCKKSWDKTSKKELEESDIVVFMTDKIREDSVDLLKPKIKKYFVWNIEDIGFSPTSKEEIMSLTRQCFLKIKMNVDEMFALLRK